MIEVQVLPGTGSLHLTGQAGETMRGVAMAALTVVRSRARDLGLNPDFFARGELHIHAHGGAPGDDGAAGIAVVVALASALTGRSLPHRVAMAGEITLHGRVLALSSIRERVLAARRAGVREIVLPAANRTGWDGLSDSSRQGMRPVFVGTVAEVFEALFSSGKDGG